MSAILLPTQKVKEALQLSTFTVSKEKNNILANALIEISNGNFKITSKNSITKATQTVKIENSEINETILINPYTLFNVFKELKEDKTELIITEKIITIKNSNFKTNIKTLDKNLYPIDTEEESEKITNLTFNKIKHLFKSTIPYPDKNDVAREYTGVFFEIEKETLNTSATDHFRLINIKTKANQIENEISFIIENDGAALISKIDMDDIVELYKTKNSIIIKDQNKKVECKIINGNFPEYKTILLDENSNFVDIDRKNLLSSIKRISITNIDNEMEFEIKPNENMLIVSSKNQEGEESIDKMEIKEKNSQNDIKIKIDSHFAISFLSQVASDDVRIFYRTNEEPIMIKSTDGTHRPLL
jgi:DNA polymerase-3 subunit beta